MFILASHLARNGRAIIHRELSTTRSLADRTTLTDIENVVVVGGALMGSGIAQVAAQNNFNVIVADESDGQLQSCMVNIGRSLKSISKERFPSEPRNAKKFVDETLGRIEVSQDAVEAVKNADIVIEAITENIQAKQLLMQQLDMVAPHKTIFVSNTSSLTISDIGNLTSRKDRMAGLHLFTPVPLMKLCEVIRAKDTSQQTFDTLIQFAKDIGKSPVACEDTPGFVVNKLQMPNLMEAIRFHESGLATIEDIDTAMKLGAGHEMGPFEQIDYIGLDTLKRVIDGWREREPENPAYAPSPLLNKMVLEQKLGRKHMQGFYKYKSW